MVGDRASAEARPLIAVTSYGRDAEENRFSLPAEYFEGLRRAGAAVCLLCPGEPDLGAWIERLDGLVLAGGGDLSPELYGGAGHETIYMTDLERDRTELALAEEVLERGLPTLGICRGTQVLNVALGGTLHAHLPDVYGESVAHRAPPRVPVPHAVEVEAGSALASIVGSTRCEPYSWHHQAIDALGEGLRVVARAPDGVIEAVEFAEHPWLQAVQWHPELSAAKDPSQQRIFDAFVEAVRRRRSRERGVR